MSSIQYGSPFTLTDAATVKFRSWDAGGNAEPVRSQAIKIDSTAPTARIAAPLEGERLTGQITVKVEATDAGSGVTNVDLYVDGNYIAFTKSKSSPYEIVLPAGTLALGNHRLKAYVTDALGQPDSLEQVNVAVAG